MGNMVNITLPGGQYSLPDGTWLRIIVNGPGYEHLKRLKYADENGFLVGSQYYTEESFMDFLNSNDFTCEVETDASQPEGSVAYCCSSKGFLVIRESFYGWDWNFVDGTYKQIDGGFWEDESLSILDAREESLKSLFPEEYQNFAIWETDFEEIVEKADL